MSKTISRRISEMYSDSSKQTNNRRNTRGRKIQSVPIKDEKGFLTKRVKYVSHY